VDVSIIHRESQLFGLEAIDTGFAIHIKDPNIGKGKALQKVAELMKINVKEIAAIGDSENDIDMLRVSGFGIAVGNADEKTKKVADLVTKGSYGQGVLEAVNKLLGIC
ncbi:MAG: HAD-IIB family hydrolase, partial [Euryarchaeota archaeon]|nr:HAD-IIB family hydrolase [Euryarchaeota archaeon]